MSASCCRNRRRDRGPAGPGRLELADHLRDHLEQIAHDPVVRELLQHREVAGLAEAEAAAHHDLGVVGPKAALLSEFPELDQRHVLVLRGQMDLFPHDVSAARGVVPRCDEHVPPDRGHLGAVLLAQDVGERLAAKTRADHVEVAVRIDVELHAVRREARLEDRVEPSAEVPPVLRRAEQHDLRLVVANELRHHLGIRPRAVDPEHRVVDDDHSIEAVADRMVSERIDVVAREDSGERRPTQVREPPALADQLHGDIAEALLAVLQEHPDPAEMGLVLEDVAVRHPGITPSARSAANNCRTASLGSPVNILPARGGNFTVSTFATMVGELRSPTFFGSIPTSAQDQWATTPPRFTRIFPVSEGSRGRLHPKFTVTKHGVVVSHHSVPSSAVRRARILPSTTRTSDAYVTWGNSRWPAIPGPT